MSKVKQIPSLHQVQDPIAKDALEAMAEQLKAMEGRLGAEHHRPTKQQMVDAGITNADLIET